MFRLWICCLNQFLLLKLLVPQDIPQIIPFTFLTSPVMPHFSQSSSEVEENILQLEGANETENFIGPTDSTLRKLWGEELRPASSAISIFLIIDWK